MSQDPLEVVREQFAATNERDFERAMALYADDVVLVVDEGFLNTGTFRGEEAVGEWFGDWFRAFGADYSFEEGKITRVQLFPTREEAMEAASLPEWSGTKTD